MPQPSVFFCIDGAIGIAALCVLLIHPKYKTRRKLTLQFSACMGGLVLAAIGILKFASIETRPIGLGIIFGAILIVAVVAGWKGLK